MDTIAFFLSTPEKVGIYTALALSTSSMLLLALYVRRKFARANGMLTAMTEEWTDAESRFFKVADVAEQRINAFKLTAETVIPVSPSMAPPGEVSLNVRKQVVSMGKRGKAAFEIAGVLGLGQAEVEVLLGMARIAGGRK